MVEVEIEENITRLPPVGFANGAGPLWCYGSPAIVRDGDQVFVAVSPTDTKLNRLCNTRWSLFARDTSGWRETRHGDYFDEREPCPLVLMPGNRLMLSANPLLDPYSEDRAGPCLPHLLEFGTDTPAQPPIERMPQWDREYDSFCEHSYRGAGVDQDEQLLLLLNIDGHEGYAWSLMDRSNDWIGNGHIEFPIRACYPQVGLHNGGAHIMAVGDILETNEEWRAFKREHTGNDWDYDFRRLFYCWAPDIRKGGFQDPIEIDSYESTAGYIRNLDMWIDPDGLVHILYASRNIWHAYMRDRFFPDEPLVSRLEYRVLSEGEIIGGRTLVAHTQDEDNPEDTGPYFTSGGFHVGSDGALRVVLAAGETGLWVAQIHPDTASPPDRVEVEIPLTNFAMPARRNGSTQIDKIDLYGTGSETGVLRYIRLSV